MRGFTLIEFLVVVVILGIILGIGFSLFSKLRPDFNLSSASQNLISDLNWAKSLSVEEQVEYGVKFFIEENKYQIIKYNDISQVISEKNLIENISFEKIEGFSDNELRFNPYGTVRENGIITLINNRNNKTKTIEVRPSGFVKI